MLVILLIALPTIFAMLVWVVVTAMRLMRPDEPIPLEEDPIILRLQRMESRVPVAVGAQDIRELERRGISRTISSGSYDYLDGHSDGFPVAWLENLSLRRN
jgi:hypothetical protein